MKTELTYRTFDELIDAVMLDLQMYAGESMIQHAQLIKVAQRVNYELGLRIYKTKQDVIEINHGKARLPDDFYVLNYALLCSHYKIIQPKIQGTHKEDARAFFNCDTTCTHCHKPNPCADKEGIDPDDFDFCRCDKVFTNECGDTFTVIHKVGWEFRSYDEFEHLAFRPDKKVDPLFQHNAFTRHHRNVAEIRNNFIYVNGLQTGKLYISYEGALEDDEGNLLVLDHPLVNEYYEYALKQRILENLYMNGEDVVQRLQLIEQRIRPARNNAYTIVNTPDFQELQAVHDMNRKAYYKRFVSMFVVR
jgi:hypothetical protein